MSRTTRARTTRVSLALTLLIVSLGNFTASPTWAQQPDGNSRIELKPGSKALSYAVESIDAAAKTLSLAEWTTGPNGNPVKLAPITVPMGANARILYREDALPASQLKIGDQVNLRDQASPPPNVKVTTWDADGKAQPLSSSLGRFFRFSTDYSASGFSVIAVAPHLILRRGGIPADKTLDAGFLNLPVSNGDNKQAGLLTLAQAEDSAGTVATLKITDTTTLEFNRVTPVDLAALVELKAAGKVWFLPVVTEAADGTLTVAHLDATLTKKDNAQ
jgi:hypothetical protein